MQRICMNILGEVSKAETAFVGFVGRPRAGTGLDIAVGMVVGGVLVGFGDGGHRFGNAFAEADGVIGVLAVHRPYGNGEGTVEFTSEVHENARVFGGIPVIESTLVVITVDGNLRGFVVGEVLASGDLTLGENDAGREEYLAAALVVDAVKIEFVLKFHDSFLSE